MKNESFDVGIIGGGVIGLTCAWRLAQAGARVAVFERGKIGREASWAAAGMLAAQCEAAHHLPCESGTEEYSKQAAMLDLCLQSRAMYADFADELFNVTGIDIELSLKNHSRTDWRTPGILYVQTRDDDVAFANFAQQKKRGLAVGSASAFNNHSALQLEDEGQVNNRVLVKALRQAALSCGVVFYEKENVVLGESLTHHSNSKGGLTGTRIQGVATHTGTVTFRQTLNCFGAWSERVHPVAGQIVAVKASRKIKQVIYSSDVYLVPRRSGRLLVGATSENIGFRKRVTPRGLQTLLSAACKLVPEIEDYEVLDHWAGLRPVSEDGLPILGSTLIDDNYVATGHGRNGILLAPVTAKLVTDCILNGVEPSHEFALKRFANHEH